MDRMTQSLRYFGLGSMLAIAPASGMAADLSVLYSFVGSDGAYPTGGVTIDSAGAIYGTTQEGGLSSTLCGFAGTCGTVFKLTPPGLGEEEWRRSTYFFDGYDGGRPAGGVTVDANGAIYGTTVLGGFGTLFRLTPRLPARTIYDAAVYRFSAADGKFPVGGVAVDAAGVVYGTTSSGGAFGYGTVFRFIPEGSAQSGNGIESYHFTGISDGGNPLGGVIVDQDGAIYGTTAQTQPGAEGPLGGTAFKLSPPRPGQATYQINSVQFGGVPRGGLFLDAGGSVYGTTSLGFGSVFKLTPVVGSDRYTFDQFNFSSIAQRLPNGALSATKGARPSGNVVVDAAGVVFGTTEYGGTGGCSVGGGIPDGCGTIFKLIPPGPEQIGYTHEVIYNFTGGADGARPSGNLVKDVNGVLYGAAISGGAGFGVIFALEP